MFLYAYFRNHDRKGRTAAMTLFDPYSHSRVHELRQEQLNRKARLREKLGLDRSGTVDTPRPLARIATAIARVFGKSTESGCPQPGSVRPALDS